MVAGLTGGIGSGKTVVARLLELLGCQVFNSDEEARAIYFDLELKPGIIDLLGKEAYLSEQEINKLHISTKIFNDAGLRTALNAVIHPAVKKRFISFKEKHVGQIIIKETALLFETGQAEEMDAVIMVAADDRLRMERVMKRDGLSEEEVLKKMNSQLSQEEKIRRSNFVIYNNEKELVIGQVLAVYEKLKAEHV